MVDTCEASYGNEKNDNNSGELYRIVEKNSDLFEYEGMHLGISINGSEFIIETFIGGQRFHKAVESKGIQNYMSTDHIITPHYISMLKSQFEKDFLATNPVMLNLKQKYSEQLEQLLIFYKEYIAKKPINEKDLFMYNSNCQKKFSIISGNHDSTVFHTFLEDFGINSGLLITDDSATFSERLTQYIREFYGDDVCKVYDGSIEERKNLSLELEVSGENLKKLVNILLSNEFIETRKGYNNNLSLGGLLYHQFVKGDMTILFATQESGNQDSNRILSSLIEVEVIGKQPDLVNFTKLEKIIALHDFSANIG